MSEGRWIWGEFNTESIQTGGYWLIKDPPPGEPHPDCLKCCGNCKSYRENKYGRLDCSNEQSDLFDDAVELNDICDEWKWRVRSDIGEYGE